MYVYVCEFVLNEIGAMKSGAHLRREVTAETN